MAVKIVHGNLFDSEMKTLTNTVNCVGVMGKGIALEFKNRFPEMYKEYRRLCDKGLVRLGEPYLYEDLFGTSILNFPTKNHWRSFSRIEDIEDGLDYFASKYAEWGITSIAFPQLGCGNGGLDWNTVRPLMTDKLDPLDLEVEIYAKS